MTEPRKPSPRNPEERRSWSTPETGSRECREIGSDVVNRGGKIDAAAIRTKIAADPRFADLLDADDADWSGSDAVARTRGDDDAPNRVVFTLTRDLEKRLDKYLTDRIPFMSRTQLQRLVDEGGVLLNGRATKASTKLRLGDVVEVFVPPPPPTETIPEDIALDVLFEDEHLIVLNKQPDIIVHPARSHRSGTMINALAFHFQNRSRTGGSLSEVGKEFARPGVVHRLDRDTSGVIVFAKTEEAHWKIARQFENRTTDKRYIAVVHGEYPLPIDRIDAPIGPHPSREKGYREKWVVRHDELGKPSLTICRVRRVWRVHAPVAAAFSLVELELKTGRTHQIRVHLSHMGFPIAGDDMYGGRPVSHAMIGSKAPGAEEGLIINRQALHAATLSFRHPITGDPLSFTAPLRGDMAGLVAALSAVDPASVWRTPSGSTIETERLSGDGGR